MIRLPWCACCPEAITRVLLFSHLGHHIHAHRSHQPRPSSPGPQDQPFSLICKWLQSCNSAAWLWQVWRAVMLWLIMKSMCLPGQCLHTVFILLLPYHGCLLLLLLWCCGVAGAGVVFVRVNNWWKVSPPRVSRVMGTFIAAFINLHITITTEGRLLFHVISAEKEKIIGLPKKQGCWCKTIWF